MKHGIQARLSIVASLAAFGIGLGVAAEAAPPIHPTPLHSQPFRRPVSPRPGNTRPPVPGRGGNNWRPHLEFALQALFAADQALHSSAAPNVPQVLASLKTAYLELQRLPPIFQGHRAEAMRDIVRAAHHLRQSPPKPGAAALTEQAIMNAQACAHMHV